MRFRQLLDRLSERQLRLLAQSRIWNPGISEDFNWSAAAVDAQAVAEAASRLTAVAAAVLKEMLLSFPAVPAEEERLLQNVRKNAGLSGAEARYGLRELERSGILFALRKQWGEYLYFMPIECFLLWQAALWPGVKEEMPDYRAKLLNGQPLPYRRTLGKQLLSAFAALAKAELGLTKKGVLAKKTIDKVKQAVELEESVLRSFAWQWTQREHYPLTVAFVLEAASMLGLLRQTDVALSWNYAALSEWLHMDEAARERELLGWCLALLLPQQEAPDAHEVAWAVGLMDGSWRSNRQYRRPASPMRNASLSFAASTPCWLTLFHGFGWLEAVVVKHEDGEEEKLFKWSPVWTTADDCGDGHGRTPSPVVTVQPNGELLADARCPFNIRWELELLAERLSDEQIVVYQLERDTVALALEQGRTKDSITAFLRAASGSDKLPDTVEAMLEAWTARACRFSFMDALLLRCDSVEMACIIDSNPELAALVMAKLGPTDYIVRKSELSKLRLQLKQTGYPPRKEIASEERGQSHYPLFHTGQCLPGCGFPHADDASAACGPFIYSPYSLHHLELAARTEPTGAADLTSAQGIPALWSNQLRAYHHSTRRELLEQALGLETTVELSIKRELHAFVPEKLVQDGQDWSIIGLLRDEKESRLVKLTPDMWDEMRLVLPARDEGI
jgi:hypothetical protein